MKNIDNAISMEPDKKKYIDFLVRSALFTRDTFNIKRKKIIDSINPLLTVISYF